MPFDRLSGAIDGAEMVGGPAHSPSLPTSQFPWWLLMQSAMFAGWLIGLARFMAAAVALRRFLRKARPWDLDEKANVFVHDAVLVPLSTVVSGRPIVVLPSWMKRDLSHARIALAHERQHIRHRDPHWAVLFSLWAIALWWHPLRHSWRRRLELDQELVCDSQLVRSGIDRRQYWQTLLAVAARSIDAPGLEPALGLLGRSNNRITDLERRIKEMQRPTKRTHRIALTAIGAAVIAAQVWLACGFFGEPDAAKAATFGELSAQNTAMKLLAQGMRNSGARSGRVIVSHTPTGQILAAGGFDKGQTVAPNRALIDPVRPWSLAKPVLAAMAIEHRTTTANAKHDTGKATHTRSGDLVRDYKPLGILTTREVVAKSSNVGAVQIAQRLGLARAKHGLSRFSLRRLGGTPLTDGADIAMGAGEVAPLNLVRFYQAIRRGGELIVEPARTCGTAPTVKRIMSASTSTSMMDILHHVVTHGTGYRAASKRLSIAGKTASGSGSAAFIGLTPRIAVWVMLEHGDSLVGGKDAAPIARNILEAMQTEKLPSGC